MDEELAKLGREALETGGLAWFAYAAACARASRLDGLVDHAVRVKRTREAWDALVDVAAHDRPTIPVVVSALGALARRGPFLRGRLAGNNRAQARFAMDLLAISAGLPDLVAFATHPGVPLVRRDDACRSLARTVASHFPGGLVLPDQFRMDVHRRGAPAEARARDIIRIARERSLIALVPWLFELALRGAWSLGPDADVVLMKLAGRRIPPFDPDELARGGGLAR